MAAVPDDAKAMDLRSTSGAGLVMAMAVQGAAQGAAAGGASRQAIAAAVAAALRTTWALLAEVGSEEDAELAMRWQAMEPAMRQQLRGAQPGGAARARRNVGAHVDLGKGVEALRQALAQPQRAQRGGRCGPRVPAPPGPVAADATEDYADGVELGGSLNIGEPDVDECEGTDQVIVTPEGQLLGEVQPSSLLSAAVGEDSELDVDECEGTDQVVNSAEVKHVPEAPRDVEPGGDGGRDAEEQLRVKTEGACAAAAEEEDEGLPDGQDLPVDGVDGIGTEYGCALEGKEGECIFSDAVQARVRCYFSFGLRVALLLGVAFCPFAIFDWGTGLACVTQLAGQPWLVSAPYVIDLGPLPDPYQAARQAFPKGERELQDLALWTLEEEHVLEFLVERRRTLEHALAVARRDGVARTIEGAEDAEGMGWSLRRLSEDIRELEALRPHGFDSG
ncbi:unnamed protein product [Prorocentrum cordatum]|uniref:Uncharacterized protein n=1 Tax=Prorocentrum cordatum TaxID=2364126 RepID=A0ABN9UR77_9DINO|nr:unnamed protein product [Polarella glacialis]